jgi:hypothetical protein
LVNIGDRLLQSLSPAHLNATYGALHDGGRVGSKKTPGLSAKSVHNTRADPARATTGLRRGEALALGWEGVNLDAGRVSVRSTLSVSGYEISVTEPKTSMR